MQSPIGARSGAETALENLGAPLSDVVRETRASVGLLYLLPPGARLLRLALVTGVSPEIAAPWTRVPMDALSPVTDAIREGRLLWLRSQEEMARRYPQIGLVLPYDFMLAAAPVPTGGTGVQGGIALLWPARHPPHLSPDQHEAITTCCRNMGALLERAADDGHPVLPPDEPWMLPALPAEATSGQAMAAYEFAERLPVGCCALNLDGRLTFINSAGAQLVGADAAYLVGNRPWEVLPWLRAPVCEDSYRAAAVTRRPAGFTAVRPPDTTLHFQLYPGDNGISIHITPDAQRPDAPQTATPVGAMALYHLTHLAVVLAEAVGVHDVIDLVADQIVPAFGPQGLVLMTADEGRLHIAGHRGYDPDFLSRFDGTPLAARTPPTHALTTGDPAFFTSFADFQHAYPDAPRHRGRSAWAFLPLTASGRLIGSLVLSYDQERPFPPAERALLTSLAGLIAQALDRARLYDTKHALARTLQQGLLPHTLPHIPGLEVAARYLPAGHGMDIGGDFYDLIHPAPTTAVAVIGDVQGHNPTAAALMGQVRTAVHSYATTGTAPDEVLACTNRLLTDLDTELFTSCLAVELCLTHHRARLACAGHPPPLLRHPDGHTDVLRATPGLLLGIDSDADYLSTEIALPPGAVLALYTDGLVELPGVDIDETIDALARHLARTRAQDLDELADALVEHAERSAPRHDDIALLLVSPTARREGRHPPSTSRSATR
ncbi:SpoIIE family protein phosphatase [Streptomyces sp. NPDC089424]|uniref:SpoIIE family protein phosphatase n=1 Tax=Streptomyces sp. NPDC089424 TaxID=3365917 RepID=UPI003803C46D